MNQKCVRFYGQWRSQDVFIGVSREGPATSLGGGGGGGG